MPRVETVLGSIEPDMLGVTLPHEHVIFDLSPRELNKHPLNDVKLNLENLWIIRENPSVMKDNLTLMDEKLATDELKKFKELGGRSVCEVTLPKDAKKILALQRISQASGLNIIAATGFNAARDYSFEIKQKSAEELCDIMIHDLKEGIDETGIKAGLIGEIIMSSPPHKEEIKVLRAAAQAQKETGACISIHQTAWDRNKKKFARNGQTYLDIIQREGGNLKKCIMDHMDAYSNDNISLLGLPLDYHRSILNQEVCIEYDIFGRHYWNISDIYPGASFPSDRERIAALVELCKQGYDKQILLSQDVCKKIYLTKFGGFGYAYLLRQIIPVLKYAGVKDKQIINMLIENPKRLLSL